MEKVGSLFGGVSHFLSVLLLEGGGGLRRCELFHLVDGVGGDTLATSSDTLDEGKLLDIDLCRAYLSVLFLLPDQ